MGIGIAALVTWVITAAGGFVMLGIWLTKRGATRAVAATTGEAPDVATDAGVGTGVDVSRGGTGTRLPAGLVFGHVLLAALGLVIWIVHLFTDNHTLAWTAFGMLLVVAVLGATMFLRWLPQRSRGERTAESTFPTAVVYGHGLFAVVTVILVLLAALEIGG